MCLSLALLAGPAVVSGQSVPVLSNPSGCQLGLPLRDETCRQNGTIFQPDVFNIVVSNAPGTVMGGDVYLAEVHLVVAHTWVSDLGITLRSPSGATGQLMRNNGDGNDHLGDPSDSLCNTYTRFSLNACLPIQAGLPPFTAGAYRPIDNFFVFNDGSNPNGTWQLQVCDFLPNDVGSLEYVHLVFAPLTCLPITDVAVQGIDGTEVTLGWLPADFCGTTVIEYGPPGFVPGTGFLGGGGTVVVADCHPFDLTGLAAETAYEVYVRRYCEETMVFSGNACPAVFTTGCQPPAVTVLEDFDEQVLCQPQCTAACDMDGQWQNVPGNAFQWLVNAGSTPTAGTGPSGDVSGGGRYVYLETSGSLCPAGSRALLHSPCFVLDKQGTDTCHVSFHYHLFGNTMGTLRLEASTDGGFTWTALWQVSGNQGDQWRKAYVGLGAFADGTLMQLRFAGTRGNGLRGNMALDEIAIHGSQSLGFPDTRYYVDNDGDGFGQSGNFVLSCAATPPPGYALVGGDCNDNDPTSNPAAPEIPCDNIDNNCNGMADDVVLPAPLAMSDTICSGEQAIVCATPSPGNLILWYDAPVGGNIFFIGECYEPALPANNSQVPAVYRFYAGQTQDFECFTPDGGLAEVIAVVYPNPAPLTEDTPAICPGDLFDLASVNIVDTNFLGGALLFYDTLSGNALDDLIVSPDSSRRYYYRLSTEAGCTAVDSFELMVLERPSAAFAPADSFSLCRESMSTVQVLPSGGAGGYSYNWSTGSTLSFIGVQAAFSAGTRDAYYVTLTDAAGCERQDSVIITTISNIDSVRREITNVSVCMGNDGAIRLTPLNGLPPFSFQWTGSTGISGTAQGIPSSMLITGLTQGSYRVTITDSSEGQCRFVMRNILVQGPDAVINEPAISPVSCAGAADGEICISIQGGGNGSSYLWSTGDTTSCVSQLAGGNYTVTVTTGDCAAVLTDLIVLEPSALILRPATTAPQCHDTSDGRISMGTFGGTPPYQYLWAHGPTTRNVNGLAAGTYTVTVTDANGCTSFISVELAAPPALSIQTLQYDNISCTGQTDGAIWVLAEGGRAPYQYRWSNGANTSLVSGLVAGSYTVSITDFNNCETSRTFSILEPLPISVAVEDITLPICLGDNTGEVSVSATGGTAPFTYAWSDGQSGSTRNQLGVGTVSVIARDNNGCTSAELSIVLNSASSLSLSSSISAPFCQGPATGSISLQPQGQAPFSYLWSNGATTPSISGLQAGQYPVTITDGRACVYDTVIVVAAPQVFNATVAFSPPNCFNVSDGVANVILQQAGTPPIQFLWQDGNQQQNRANLSAGTYALTISDANGCTFSPTPFALANPPQLQINIEELGPINCFGQTNSYIELSTEGGTPPYTHNWVGLGIQTEDLNNIGAGQYRLVVTDSRNCAIDTLITVPQPPLLSLSAQVVSGPVCGLEARDTIISTAAGGTPPYQYLWSTGHTTPSIADAPPGNYDLMLTDANGCQRVITGIKVSNRVPALQLSSFSVSPAACFGGSDGSMTATISGGSGQYYYFFSPFFDSITQAQTLTINGLSASPSYSVIVTDLATGCTVQSANITAPPLTPLQVNIDNIRDIDCFGGSNGAVFTSAYGGLPPYTYEWRNSAGLLVSQAADPQLLPAGSYTLRLEDANGCVITLPGVVVESPNALIVLESAIITHVACKDESTGAIAPMVTGGVGPYTYQWSWNGQQGSTLQNIPAGTYGLTVTDALTCRLIVPSLVVSQPPTSITVSVDSLRAPSCHNSADGYLQVHAQGGYAPYTYAWRHNGMPLNDAGPELNDLGGGNYELRLTDSVGCQRIFDYVLTPPTPIAVSILADADTLRVVTAGGTPEYSYLWSDGSTSPAILAVPGILSYLVTVTDANGCTSTAAWNITATTQPSPVATLRLYPNPATQLLWLEAQFWQALPLEIAIFDATGRRVQQHSSSASQRLSLRLDMSAHPPGVYYVLARQSGGGVLFIERFVLL